MRYLGMQGIASESVRQEKEYDFRAREADSEIFERCNNYMNLKKPYLVPGFSLEDLSNAVFTNKLYVSRSINNLYGNNFRYYVNSYRINYAKELFRQNMSLRVTELSDMSGFSSSSTFSLAFKLMSDGESPAKWCSRIREESLDADRQRRVASMRREGEPLPTQAPSLRDG